MQIFRAKAINNKEVGKRVMKTLTSTCEDNAKQGRAIDESMQVRILASIFRLLDFGFRVSGSEEGDGECPKCLCRCVCVGANGVCA